MTSTNTQENTGFFAVSDSAYNALKATVQYIMPGLVTFWIAIGTIWGIPKTEPIAASLTALTALLGVFVAISKSKFSKLPPVTDGDLLLDVNEEGYQALTVALEKPPTEFRDQDVVQFRVVKGTGTQE